MPTEVGMAIAEAFQKDYHIIQVCREDSYKIPGAEHVFNPMANLELFGLVVASDKRAFIDSSLQHAAAAFDKPSTVLWVGTSPTVFGYEQHTNITANPPSGNTKLPGAYLYDYQFTGELHECPYKDIREMFDINKVIKSAPSANPNGDGMKKILKDLKEAGSMTKRELISQRWGSGIKFTPYRRALMEHPNVMDTHQRISTYQWVDKKDESNA